MPKVEGSKPAMAKKSKKDKAPAAVPREVKYKEVEIRLCQGGDALTVDMAKQLVGWEEVKAKDKSTSPEIFTLTSLHVRMRNNTRNRYLTPSWLLTLVQEHLNKRWRFNGESIVVGDTDLLLSGQHRLLSLILAEMERTGTPILTKQSQAMHWEALWQGPVTMETLIVYGVKEDDDTFKTLNQGKPGTLAEVLYRSDYFAKLPPGDRKVCSRITDKAVNLLWSRTGANRSAFNPRRTHGEAMDFLDRHGRVLKAVKHIFEEDQESAIGKYVSPGLAAGLMYLMAASMSDGDTYHNAEPPSEKVLDFNAKVETGVTSTDGSVEVPNIWERACEFWVLLGSGAESFGPVRQAIGALANEDTGGTSTEAVKAVLCKAWQRYLAGDEQTEDGLSLEHNYKTDKDGIRHLVDVPTAGGIDLGNPKAKADEPAAEDIKAGTDEAHKERDKKAAERKVRAKELAEKFRQQRQTAKGRAPGEVPQNETKLDENGRPPAPDIKPDNKAPAPSLIEQLKAKKAEFPDHLLIFKVTGGFGIWGNDAKTAAKVVGVTLIKRPDGIDRVNLAAAELQEAIDKLLEAGKRVVVLDKDGGNPVIREPRQSTGKK